MAFFLKLIAVPGGELIQRFFDLARHGFYGFGLFPVGAADRFRDDAVNQFEFIKILCRQFKGGGGIIGV